MSPTYPAYRKARATLTFREIRLKSCRRACATHSQLLRVPARVARERDLPSIMPDPGGT